MRACKDAPVRHSLAGRAETPVQARLLAQLRDEGPLSKAQLADALQVSRTTVGAEVGRLAELGLAVEAGPAASRGGRRSTLVDLSPDIRFAGIAIGATGRLGGRHRRPAHHARGQAPRSATSSKAPRRCSPSRSRPSAS